MGFVIFLIIWNRKSKGRKQILENFKNLNHI